jgi:SAM-dependent methyltransferase
MIKAIMEEIADVRQYWNEHPLLSHELNDVGSSEFFDELDRIKREDSDVYALPYWGFKDSRDRKVLDIGCGPGWVSVQYALAGAIVNSVDLTPRAIEITNLHCKYRQTSVTAQVGNAEDLPFDDEQFDLVVASGVLHHTPDTQAAFAEAFRVTMPGGQGRITLYRKGVLHSRLMFPLTKLFMRLSAVRHPGGSLTRGGDDVDEFIRSYDGAENPVGIGKSDDEWAADLERVGWLVEGREIHFFPRRFLPFNKWVPNWVHKFLDQYLGTMIYFRLQKPN